MEKMVKNVLLFALRDAPAELEIRAWFFVRMSSFLKKKSGSLFALFALKKNNESYFLSLPFLKE